MIIRRGLGTAAANPSQEYNAALNYLNGGEAIGSPAYLMNLAAAQKQPGFNQSQFDQYWNALTVSGTGYNVSVADSPKLPAFIQYTGTAPSNIPGTPAVAATLTTPRATTGTNLRPPRGAVSGNKGIVTPSAPPLPPAPPQTETTFVDRTGSTWSWNGVNWVNVGAGMGPVVVNPSPPSQPTNTGTSQASPDSTVSTANGSTLTTDIISGVPNTALFIGAGALVLILLWQTGGKR